MRRIKVRRERAITLSLLLGLSLAGLLLMLARPPVSRAATLTVTSTADSGPGSLRQAIIDAFSGDTITFAAGIATINLTSGELLINKNLTISGPGANLLSVARDPAFEPFRIFNIAPASVNATISGLTIANGNASSGGHGGGIYNSGTATITNSIISGNLASSSTSDGGGIYNSGTATITNSTISGNIASFNGGGIYNAGTATITNSTISGNLTPGFGSGIANASGTLTITNSTISGNSISGFSASFGGGIANFGMLTITNSTISGNPAQGDGGGIANFGMLTITNSTISGNPAQGDGGGIYHNGGTVTITNSTISGNPAQGNGGGIYRDSGTVNARNTIIALNTAPSGPDFFGTLTSQGYNLIGNTSGITSIGCAPPDGCTGNQLNVNPLLEDLEDNGGPTQTHALRSGSPAIEGGNSFGSNTDQRGLARPVVIPNTTPIGDGSDIGAYEVQADLLPVCNTINRIVNNDDDSGTGSLRFVIAEVCAGSTITFASNVTGAINLTNGQLFITKTLTINGPGADLLSVQRNAGAANFRIFNIPSASVIANISGLTIANGNVTAGVSFGGGISNTGTLTLTNSTITGNSATVGGGIFNDGGVVTLTRSTISGNSGNIGAAGIYNFNSGTLTITNSTISGNMALGGNGGGIVNSGATTLTNSTITGNSATGAGGGVHNFSGTVRARNTIIAMNTAGSSPDFNGPLTSENFNLIGNSSGATITPAQFSDQRGTAGSPINPMLGPLQNNGGPTFTHALLSSPAISPAIDKGNSSGSLTDQRGFTRPVDNPGIDNATGGDGGDIGAFETVPCPFALSPQAELFPARGGQGSVNVSSVASCSWSASASVNWIVITSEENGAGNEVVTFEVRDNFTGSARQGSINVSGQTFTLVQEGALGDGCQYSINPKFESFLAAGGTGTVNVTGVAGCAWQAVSSANWITITSGGVGIGNGAVSYSVGANPGPSGRKGTIIIAGKVFAVKQKGS